MTSIVRRLVGTVAASASVGSLLMIAPPAPYQQRPERLLTPVQLERTVGGMEASLSRPSNNSTHVHDNPRATAVINSWLPSGDYYVSFHAANSSGSGSSRKIAGQVMTLPQYTNRTFDTRTNFPLTTANQDIWMEYYDQADEQSYPAFGNNLRQNIRLSADLRVAGVRFHRLNGQTNLPTAYTNVVDQLNNSQWGKNLQSADAVFSESCSLARWNFRYTSTRNSTIPSNCTTVVMDSEGNYPQTCRTAFANLANSAPHLYHVFLVRDITNSSGTRVADGFAPYLSNYTVVRHNLTGARFTTALAHEFGHSMGLGHVNQPCDEDNPCPSLDGSEIDFRFCDTTIGMCRRPGMSTADANARNSCGSGGAGANLMCTDGGRDLQLQQCFHMENEGTPRVPHQNCVNRSCS